MALSRRFQEDWDTPAERALSEDRSLRRAWDAMPYVGEQCHWCGTTLTDQEAARIWVDTDMTGTKKFCGDMCAYSAKNAGVVR